MSQGVLDKILVEISNITENMATKSDLSELRSEMATKSDLSELRSEMATKSELSELRSEMATKSDLADLQKSIEVIRKQTAENAELRSSHFELKADVDDMAADIKLLKRACIQKL